MRAASIEKDAEWKENIPPLEKGIFWVVKKTGEGYLGFY
jgi:hypothetical protein